MKYLFTLILCGTIFCAVAQKKQYVCTPCGYDCDKQVFDKPGKCSSCGMVLVDQATIKFGTLTPEQLCARVTANPKVILLDVRSAGEFNGTSKEVASFGHFENAININVTDLEASIKELNQYKDKEVIVYCSHSHRSPAASYFLSTHGFKDVKNMSGGVSTMTDAQTSSCLKKIYIQHAH